MMNNTTPATATTDDAALRATLERGLATSREVLQAEAAKIGVNPSFAFAFEQHGKAALRAETRVAIFTRALRAPAGSTARALTLAIAEFLNPDSASSDPIANAVEAVQRQAARQVLSAHQENVDPALLVERLI